MEFLHSIQNFFASVGLDVRSWFMADWMDISLWQALIAFIFISLSFFARRFAASFLQRLVIPWLGRFGGENSARILEALSHPVASFLALVAFHIAVLVLIYPAPPGSFQESVSIYSQQVFEVAVAAIVVWALTRLIDVFGRMFRRRAEDEDLPIDAPIVTLLQRAIKAFVAVVGGLLIVQHMGYPIASLLGGLGIGGLAVALAAQDTLANVFGSIIVFIDKPYKVGDWVRIGEVDGFVETIGFRSTRIRTWPKALVSIPNKTIANAQIENWSAMPLRRVSYTFYIRIETPPERVQEMLNRMRAAIAAHPGIDQTFHMLHFTEFSDKGLGIMVYYFTKSTKWKEHMDVRQEMNLQFMNIMRDLGIALSGPVRTLYFPGSVDQGLQAYFTRPETSEP